MNGETRGHRVAAPQGQDGDGYKVEKERRRCRQGSDRAGSAVAGSHPLCSPLGGLRRPPMPAGSFPGCTSLASWGQAVMQAAEDYFIVSH